VFDTWFFVAQNMIMMPNRTKVSQVVNSDSLITFFLILVLLVSFAGLLLTGCGGDSGPGLTATDAGYPKCEIPSPTGDAPSTLYGVARDTPNYIVVADDVEAACNETKVWESQEQASWLTAVKGADCSDAAHDFKGTSNVSWCVNLIQASELSTVDSSSNCSGLPSDGSTCLASVVNNAALYPVPSNETCRGGASTTVNTNSPVCVIAAVSIGASVNQTMNRNWAICSQTGVFLGWSCGSN
jgi:hypothetical protein